MAHDELSTLETCALLDEFEQSLKSKEDYFKALQHVFALYPKFKNYSKTFLVPFPADWPGWYYPKKLIAQGHDLGNMIPEQGPFHVSLNAQQDTVHIFNFFFDKLYKSIFHSDLPQKPREFRISLCIIATLLGWMMVRKQIIRRFGNCKDHEYICILYLLEDVVPLVFYQYSIFRCGNMDMYYDVMMRMAILFICWQRRHYNKSTLSWLSDADYQRSNLPEYWSTKVKWLALITEKKFEIWHSLLRAKTDTFFPAEQIQTVARTLAAAGFMADFVEFFCPSYIRGTSENNLSVIAGKAAEFIIQLFKEIATNTGKSTQVLQNYSTAQQSLSKSKFLKSVSFLSQLPRDYCTNGKPKGNVTYNLPTFGVDVDTKCFPLSYNHETICPDLEPNPKVLCDSLTCRQTDRTVIRLGCYHMFHPTCLAANSSCPICEKPLQEAARKLARSFNCGLLTNTDHQDRRLDQRNPSKGNNQEDPSSGTTDTENRYYYQSAAWQQKVENTVNSYEGITEPVHINHRAAHTHTPATSSQTCHIPTHPHIHIPPEIQGTVTFWKFPRTTSQSTIAGRMGSNACTFINLQVCSSYFAHPSCQQLSPQDPLSQEWIRLLILAILQGNSAYDQITQGHTHNFGVLEAAQAMHLTNPILSVSAEFPADLAPQTQESAELPFYLEQAANNQRTAALFIINGNTITFLPHSDGYILVDSHCHGNYGAFLAFARHAHIWDLLQSYYELTGKPYTLGTVTKVSF